MKTTNLVKVMVLNNEVKSFLGGDFIGYVPARIGMKTDWGIIYKISKSGKTVYTISKFYGKHQFNKRTIVLSSSVAFMNCMDLIKIYNKR